ncbi:MAG: GTP 3',8-cyclase MoaA [Desulfobacteraceae bacterium]|nr:GTP 3',8-cyclase MoaA [Desulfobacteraceae bacterium]
MSNSKANNHLIDNFQRRVNYMRVSITDRCNLRCRYCMTGPANWRPKGQILTLEEIQRMVRIAVGLGITKVRLTGGEPLVRKGVVGLVQTLHGIQGLQDIALTTNGTLLGKFAQPLKEAGLRRVNISLDTMDAAGFKQITGLDLLDTVWQGIDKAAEVGFNPIKINCVVMRGTNDDQIERLAGLTREKPFHVRFIEYMPIGINPNGAQHHFLSLADMRARLERMAPLIPVASQNGDGPAQRFRFEQAQGEIGLIGSMSSHFCNRCNRIRLTADGHLRPCLLADDQIDILTPLRQGAGDDEIAALFGTALASKKGGHQISFSGNCTLRTQMTRIGG